MQTSVAEHGGWGVAFDALGTLLLAIPLALAAPRFSEIHGTHTLNDDAYLTLRLAIVT